MPSGEEGVVSFPPETRTPVRDERGQKLRGGISKRHSPFTGMSEQEVIERLRKTREELWEEKLAPHS